MAITSVKATINGSEYTLTYNSATEKWESTLTAPAGSSYNLTGGYYSVSVTATDNAGNTATVDATDEEVGGSLRLVVVEKVAPTIAVTSPGEDSFLTTGTPTITFQLRDDTIGSGGDSGINLASFTLKLDQGTAVGSTAPGMTLSPVTGGYDGSYTPQTGLSDGPHTVTLNVSDNDGNAATPLVRTFKIDTVEPELDVTHPPVDYVTNQTALTVAGETNDTSSSPVTVTITLNGVDQGAVTVDPVTGAFEKSITLNAAENTIVIKATDAAGKYTTVTRVVTLNTTAPEITTVTLTPNPVDAGQTYIITVTVV